MLMRLIWGLPFEWQGIKQLEYRLPRDDGTVAERMKEPTETPTTKWSPWYATPGISNSTYAFPCLI